MKYSLTACLFELLTKTYFQENKENNFAYCFPLCIAGQARNNYSFYV